MVKYRLEKDIKKIAFDRWKEFNERQREGSVYQSPEMYELFVKTKKFDPVVSAVYQGDRIAGILLAVTICEYNGLLKYLSSRTVIYGGPVIHEEVEDKSEVLRLLLDALVQMVKHKSVFIQFRNFMDWTDYFPVFEEYGFKWMDRLNFVVDTRDREQTWKRISSSKRRQIRQALKSGAEIIEPEKPDQIRAFYDILYDLYKHKVKKPLPDWSFFENFYKMSQEGKLGMIRLIKYGDKIIGGILSPVFNDRTVFEWYICGLDSEYKKQYPSVLATWAAMEYAIENKIATFDFMGVGVPDRDYGVRDFKAKFGGEMTNYGRFGRVNNKFIYLITEIGFNFLALLKKI